MKVGNLESASAHLLGGGYGQKILCSGMKEALDRYITSNYAEVRAYTAYFLSKMGSYIDADTVINNSYLHVVNIDGDPEKVKAIYSIQLSTRCYGLPQKATEMIGSQPLSTLTMSL
jgi:hypothetical protein